MFPVRTVHQTEFLEHGTAQVDAAVAGHTAVVHKCAYAFAFLFAQSGYVAFEVVVPTGRGQQGAFKRAQCGGDVFEGNRAVFRECGFEFLLVFGNAGDFGGGIGFGRVGHFNRVEQWAAGLFFHIGGTAVPELAAQQGGIQGSRGVTGAELAFVARAGRHVVHAGRCQVVAGVTADGIAFGQAGFVPKLLAEFDLLFGKRTDFLHFGRIRQRFEHGLRAFQQGFVFGRNIGRILRGRNSGGACGSIGTARGRSCLRGFGCLSRFLAAGGQRGRNGQSQSDLVEF